MTYDHNKIPNQPNAKPKKEKRTVFVMSFSFSHIQHNLRTLLNRYSMSTRSLYAMKAKKAARAPSRVKVGAAMLSPALLAVELEVELVPELLPLLVEVPELVLLPLLQVTPPWMTLLAPEMPL